MDLTTLNGRREKMRRPVMMFGMGILLILVAAGLAVAVTKTCGRDLPCEGTDNDDVLYERLGANQDNIKGLDGRDVIDANTFNPDRDVLRGGNGRDTLLTNDTDRFDVANGGRRRDVCYVSKGDATRSCEVIRRATFRAGASNVSNDLSRGAFGR
jgi:Ca2+-binding RTX toxin-like protein